MMVHHDAYDDGEMQHLGSAKSASSLIPSVHAWSYFNSVGFLSLKSMASIVSFVRSCALGADVTI